MCKVVLSVALAAALAAVATQVLGYLAHGLGRPLIVHMAMGFTAILLLFVSQVWVLSFSVGSLWLVRRLAKESGSGEIGRAEPEGLRWRLVAVPSLLCPTLLIELFLGAMGLAVPPGLRFVHGILGSVLPALVLVALLFELRWLRDVDRYIDAADPEVGEPIGTPGH